MRLYCPVYLLVFAQVLVIASVRQRGEVFARCSVEKPQTAQQAGLVVEAVDPSA